MVGPNDYLKLNSNMIVDLVNKKYVPVMDTKKLLAVTSNQADIHCLYPSTFELSSPLVCRNEFYLFSAFGIVL
jgi:hypothetical protein